jgi:sterol desaturase/sphingolipid hydroxylase (fatty acid hydroxylase superfamily)
MEIFSWLGTTPVITWIFVGTLFVAIENLGGGHRQHQSSSRWLNARYGAVHAAAILVLSPLCNIAINEALNLLVARGRLIDLRGLTPIGLADAALTVALFIFLSDFFYYWWHRLQHRVPVFWDQHAVHHSDETVNAITAVRQHWTEFVFQSFFVSLPVLLILKTDASTIVAASVVMHAWSFFNHLDVKLPLGRLSTVVSGPEFHVIHHSLSVEHRDKNFAAYFPVFDRMFGTIYIPARNESLATGLATGERIESVLSLAIYPFVKIYKRLVSQILG